jgi:Flp pilus assembly protein CpaB
MMYLRSSRGMLVIGAVLAVVAFVLVVVLLNQKSTTTPSATGTPQPTATAGPALPSATPTVGLSVVQAVQRVPAGTRLTSDAEIHAYFEDVPVTIIPTDAAETVTSIAQWETDTHVISGTTFIGALEITNPINKGSVLRTGDYRVLPVPPLNSLSYQIEPGRVAEAIQLAPLFADNGQIMAGDYVDLLLTIRQHAVDSRLWDSPLYQSGAYETQEIVSTAKVLAVAPLGASGSVYTLSLPIQDALLVKYVKDAGGTVDMVLIAADDVKNQTVQPRTNAIVPEYFLTPQPPVRGTPGVSGSPTATAVNGVPYPFVTPLPTLTPVSR